MSTHPIFGLSDIYNAYKMVLESAAKPNGFKFLSPEQAETLAQLSPSYKSNSIWGLTSQWICSMVNRLIKFKNMTFDDAYKIAQSFKNDIDEFEKFGAKLKTDISQVKSFEDLRNLLQTSKKSGLMMNGLSQSAKLNGRARQCYSLIKNGTIDGDMVQTYEDNKYLIGYPTNLNYNKNFSAIGKWCHTGSFGDTERYWGKYAQYPVFYILNKEDGSVLCASYQDGYGEVRDQLDNYPEGFDGGNWSEFFTEIGLRKPMVEEIHNILEAYEKPDDAFQDVWDRVDEYAINDSLFNGLGAMLEGDDYGRGTGNFYYNDKNMTSICPSMPDDEGFVTRYDDSAGDEYYTFEEFREISKDTWMASGEIPTFIINDVLSLPEFKRAWENDTNTIISQFSQNVEVEDSLTMSERFGLGVLKGILLKSQISPEYFKNTNLSNLGKRLKFIRDCFYKRFVEPFKREFNQNIESALFPNKNQTYGGIDIYGGGIHISIDADEAQSLSNRIENGEFHFEKGPDIIALNLGGKNSFAVKKVEYPFIHIKSFIGLVKYVCKTPIDMEGQQTLDLRDAKEPDDKYYTTNAFVTPDFDRNWKL